MYLSNSLSWQGYHRSVTSRIPVFPSSRSKLFWYENKQLYTYLLLLWVFVLRAHRDFWSTYLPVFYWSFLVVASVLFLFLSFSKFRNTVLTSFVCSSGLAGRHSFTWPLARQNQHRQLDLALSFPISFFLQFAQIWGFKNFLSCLNAIHNDTTASSAKKTVISTTTR